MSQPLLQEPGLEVTRGEDGRVLITRHELRLHPAYSFFVTLHVMGLLLYVPAALRYGHAVAGVVLAVFTFASLVLKGRVPRHVRGPAIRTDELPAA